ncbi:polysaccharide lyase family 1 protein, partial [Glonium stellatum]
MKVYGILTYVATLGEIANALISFPGAEGFGRNAIGGRNGSVYVVTNVNDTETGSLRDAVPQTDRTVVFAVGGVINITDRIVASKRVTIPGQTAPGGGITTYGNGWSLSDADDIGRDETFSINGDVCNVTIQNSIIARGLETHSCGGLMQTDGGVSLFRNFYIDNKTRNPKVKGVNDFTNNVIYNWGGGGGYIAGDSDVQSYANIAGNYFISGPLTTVTAFTRGNDNLHRYVENNYYDDNQDGTINGKELGVTSSNYGGMVIMSSRYDYPAPVRQLTPAEAVTYATSYVGASKVRDSIDTRLISELTTWGTTGELISDETASPMYGPGTIDGGSSSVGSDGQGGQQSVAVN